MPRPEIRTRPSPGQRALEIGRHLAPARRRLDGQATGSRISTLASPSLQPHFLPKRKNAPSPTRPTPRSIPPDPPGARPTIVSPSRVTVWVPPPASGATPDPPPPPPPPPPRGGAPPGPPPPPGGPRQPRPPPSWGERSSCRGPPRAQPSSGS